MIQNLRVLWLIFLLALALPAAAMSLDEAVARARSETGAQVLSADTREVNGRRMHLIRVLGPDGRVKRLRYPADRPHRGR